MNATRCPIRDGEPHKVQVAIVDGHGEALAEISPGLLFSPGEVLHELVADPVNNLIGGDDDDAMLNEIIHLSFLGLGGGSCRQLSTHI